MFVAHAIPQTGDAELLVDGRSSILFATLAGVSLGLMTGAEHPLARGRRFDRVTGIVLRALLLFLLGVALALTGSRIAIILDYYAIMFLLVVPLLFLPRWALGTLAGVLAFAGPVLATVVDATRATPLAEVFVTYLLTGYYPAVIWLPFLLAGLIAARSGLARPRTQGWLVGAGLVLSLVGYGAAAVLQGVSAEAHSNSTAEVLGSGGLAIAIIGVLLAVTTGNGVARIARAILWPIAATGSMALTVYTAQILVLASIVAYFSTPGADVVIDYPGWPLLLGMSALSVVFASLWRATLGKGPLERALAALTRGPRRRTRT